MINEVLHTLDADKVKKYENVLSETLRGVFKSDAREFLCALGRFSGRFLLINFKQTEEGLDNLLDYIDQEIDSYPEEKAKFDSEAPIFAFLCEQGDLFLFQSGKILNSPYPKVDALEMLLAQKYISLEFHSIEHLKMRLDGYLRQVCRMV